MTICTVGAKGGTGKSTTVVTLARLWAKEHSVTILDTDKQQAVGKFKLKGVKVLPCRPDEVGARLEGMLAKCPLILIDCAPDPNISAQAIRAADLVILPTSAEYLELDATLRLLKALKDKYPARLLFTRYRGAQREIVASTQQRYDGQVFTTRISRSIALADAAERRLTILDTAPDSVVARQYIKLAKEILHGT